MTDVVDYQQRMYEHLKQQGKPIPTNLRHLEPPPPPPPGRTVQTVNRPAPGVHVTSIQMTDKGTWAVVFNDATCLPPVGSFVAAVAQASGETAGPSSWAPLDLTGHLDGTHTPALPELLHRTDAVSLIYAGKVHWLSGEPESLKSWLALVAATQVITAGGVVAYIDLEDGPEGIVGRLLALGLTPDMIGRGLVYLSPDGPLTTLGRVALTEHIERAQLVVIDAATEALAAQGLSSNDDTDIASWLSLLPRWAAKLGPAVVVLDHVTKDAESRGRWATGSQHKLSGLDGVSFRLETVQAGGVGMTGRSRLYVLKDRPGRVRPSTVRSAGGKDWAGDLVVDSTGPWTEAAIHPPTPVSDEPFLPTVVMAKVATVLTKHGRPMTKAVLETRVGGRAAVVRQAIAELEDAGYLEVSKGPNNSRLHTLLKPYPPEEVDQ